MIYIDTNRFSLCMLTLCLALSGLACSDSKCPKGAVERGGVCTETNDDSITGDAGGDDAADGGIAAAGDAGTDAGDGVSIVDAGEGADASEDAATPGMDAKVPVVDECDEADCDEAASCRVKAGKAVCKCGQGYEGDGKTCERNLCLPLEDEDPACGANALCTLSDNDKVQCACEKDFFDCDANQVGAVPGCEANLMTDGKHCGDCSYACAGQLGCDEGTCEQPVARLVADEYNTCALLTSDDAATPGHEVKCWGRNSALNDERALGVPTFTESNSPVPLTIPGLRVRDISSSGRHTCAVLADKDAVSCWGNSTSSQLGTLPGVGAGDRVETALPGVTQVTVGALHSCALTNEVVKCWGDNNYAQLGAAASSTDSAVPVVIAIGEPVVEVRASSIVTCALAKSGKVYCWPSGSSVIGAVIQSSDDKPIADATRLVASSDADSSRQLQNLFCVVRKFGKVSCWGLRWDPIPGVVNAVNEGNKPIKSFDVVVPSDFTSIAVGVSHLCVLRPSGRVECMGLKPANGALGFVSAEASIGVLTQVPGIDDALELVAGGWHTCVRRATGQVQCWGRNTQGEVGDGTTAIRATPTNVIGLP